MERRAFPCHAQPFFGVNDKALHGHSPKGLNV
jgi:hypothetical protein